MKKLLPLNSVFVVFIILLISSCEGLRKDPDYAGTWLFSEQITADDLVYNTMRTIILEKNTYEETYVIQRENSVVISAIIGTRGNLKMTHSTMIFELKELGTCDLDESEICTGDVLWYGDGSQYWVDNIPYFKKTVTGVYEVTGTSMRLTRDLNGDGDYGDTGEDITFEMI
jgi:hypothetical protein